MNNSNHSFEELVSFYQDKYSSLELINLYQNLKDRLVNLSSLRLPSQTEQAEMAEIKEELDAMYLALPIKERNLVK